MYFTVLTVIFKDDTKNKVSINTFNSKDEALKQCYAYMSQYTGVDNVEVVNVLVKNEIGSIYKNESWNSEEVE